MKNYDSIDNLSPVYNNLNVKKIVIEDGVTSIGELAFYKCSSLTNITIPGNVESIGESAFYSCDNLMDVTLQDGVKSIGNAAFILCNNLTNIVLPNSVTSIGYFAFKDCTSLTSIKIPDSVTVIGRSAFANCSSLKTISLSCKSSLKKDDFGDQADLVSYTNQHLLTKTEAKAKTCTEDGNKEYWTCEHCGKYFLSDDSNPETAKAVEQSETILPAIQHKNAELRNSSEPTETSPGYSGDLYCPDCDKVVEKGYTYWIEDNLTWKLYEDGTLNISGTGAMKDYDSDDSPATQKKDSVKKVVIEDDVTSIGNYAFSGCSSLTDITLPSSVTSIKSCAFYKCSQLASIEIPSSVTSIGNSAFRNCTVLTSITIPESVTSIGDSAFRNCTGLTSITIPDSVTSIGYAAFSDCSSLKIISLSCKSTLKKSDFGEQADLVSYTSHTLKKTEAKAATCTEKGNKEYWTCEHCGKYFLSDDTNPETATAVEQSETIIPALKHKNATTRDAVEPNGTKPGYSGDRYCPDCDTVLEKGYTYWNEGNLTWKLDADGTLNISGTGAMKDYDSDSNPSPIYNNSDVKEVVIEDGVTSIGNYAFSNCTNLTSIKIPSSVTSMDSKAFYNCSSLKTISLDCKSTLKKSDFGGQADLVSYTSHTLKKTEAKAVTCAENGNKEYWTCEHCGKYFL